MMRFGRAAAALACALAAACSGSVTGVPPAPVPSPNAGTARVTFAIVVPAGAPAARVRAPRFVSPSTQSVVVALGGTTLLSIDTSAASHACKSGAAGSRTCTARTTVRSGTQHFTIRAFDGPNGSGNLLASGTVAATLAANQSRTLHLSLNGRPVTLALAIETPNAPAGTPAALDVELAALDADGNTIVGSYGRTIRIADDDRSGSTTLSTTHVSDSSASVSLAYDGAPLGKATLSARAAGVPPVSAAFTPTPSSVLQHIAPPVKIGGVPIAAGLWDLCMGPDGNIWATANTAGAIEKITLAGKFTAYPVPHTAPEGISVGADRNLWFAEQVGDKIGKITTAGTITTYPLPLEDGSKLSPTSTTAGPDGRTWFVANGPNIGIAGAISRSGKMSVYALPGASSPVAIVTGPDRNLWITDGGVNAIVVLSTSGKVAAVHALPTPHSQPWGITVGPDKNLWFAEFNANRIGRMTPAGKLAEFDIPTALGGPLNVVSGPDGRMWYTETGGGFWDYVGKVGYVTLDGSHVRDFPNYVGLSHVHDLLFDSSGTLWYTEQNTLFSALVKFVY